jgi:teichuronic acid biosynthesis glycosyltransferase TuaG
VPRVSIIIPTFNGRRHIGETLDSLRAQDYSDWEAIVIDDASTDGTADLVDSLGDRRIQVLRRDRNEGTSAARNHGIASAGGDLLVFLDHDDLLLPQYLAKQVHLYDEAQIRYADVGIVACNGFLLHEDRQRPETYRDLVPMPAEVTLTALLKENPIFARALAPRAVVDAAGGFSPEVIGTEDYDLWLRILELGYRVVVTSEPLAIFRQGEGQLSRNRELMAQGLQVTYRRALRRGRLSRRQRRIAMKQLRLHRAREEFGLIRIEQRTTGVFYARIARALPLLVWVTLENPKRLAGSVRSIHSLTSRA